MLPPPASKRSTPEISIESLAAMESLFHELIRSRTSTLKDENVPLPELPTLKNLKWSKEEGTFFRVPGMYGGFRYWLEGEEQQVKLVVESACRIFGGSGQRHEISPMGVRLVKDRIDLPG